MKLVLASAGVYTQEIVDKVVELVGKPIDQIKVAIINEAYAMEHGDHRWLLDELKRIDNVFVGGVEFVNLLALDIETIKARVDLADIIYVIGGHTDYLMSVFDKSGFSEVLPEILKTKVYVGSSAGSMVLCRRNSTNAYKELYGEGDDFGVREYMNLIDVSIKPHLGSSVFPKNNLENLVEVSKGCQCQVLGLADDSALVVDGERRYLIGGQTATILNGQIIKS